MPPVNRDEDDFDAGAKFHVPADVPYIRYFVARLLQFQFYKELCIEARQYDPNDEQSKLHRCDFSLGRRSGAAGKLFEYKKLFI